jgi:hypothetical protein
MARLPKSLLKYNSVSGQALLIVLLGMAVVLTMVLSVVSRSVTDIQLTSRDDEALRAFSAAEAGVEQALIVGTNIGDTPLSDSGSSFSVTVEKLAEGKDTYAYPEELSSGESGTLWFVSHDSNGNLTCTVTEPCYKQPTFDVCWGKSSGTIPAVEVSVYYDRNPSGAPTALGAAPDFGDVQVARYTFDPVFGPGRRDENSFDAHTSTSCDIEDQTLLYAGSVNVSTGLPAGCSAQNGCLLFAKAKFIYNDIPQPLGFSSPTGTFPAQGVHIESTGQFGDSTRQIDVFRTYSEPLSIFESAVFSMGNNDDLTK